MSFSWPKELDRNVDPQLPSHEQVNEINERCQPMRNILWITVERVENVFLYAIEKGKRRNT